MNFTYYPAWIIGKVSNDYFLCIQNYIAFESVFYLYRGLIFKWVLNSWDFFRINTWIQLKKLCKIYPQCFGISLKFPNLHIYLFSCGHHCNKFILQECTLSSKERRRALRIMHLAPHRAHLHTQCRDISESLCRVDEGLNSSGGSCSDGSNVDDRFRARLNTGWW
jgi:hypothetical protein